MSSSNGSPIAIDSTAGTSSDNTLSYWAEPTRTRHAAVQSCPALKYPATFTHSTAVEMSASSKMMTGALPPSSRWTRFSVSAAFFAISLPVFTSPVSETMPTSGCRTSASPTGSPSPVMTLNTPGGKRSSASSAILSAVSGVSSDGLRTTQLPVASAGPIFQTAIISG